MRRRRSTPRRGPQRWAPEEWDTATDALMQRDGGRCLWCGKMLDNRGERHHRQRRRDGGDRLSNLVMLHPEHHREVHAHPEEARRRGFIVAFASDPLIVPIEAKGGRTFLLMDDGTRTDRDS